jgi:hypothetical protein
MGLKGVANGQDLAERFSFQLTIALSSLFEYRLTRFIQTTERSPSFRLNHDIRL